MNNKRRNYLIMPAAFCVALLVNSALAQQRGGGGDRSSISRGQHGSGVAFSGGVLSAPETASLYAMLDEEKLAHDVYATLARTARRPILRTIAEAESQHMNALRQLALRYNIASPNANNAVGQFSDPQVQELYSQLVASGSRSPLDAMKVGAKIEEMDIADLNAAISTSTQSDVRSVLESLQRGSRNHLRAFTRQMRDLGGTYDPEYLSRTEFDRIANSRGESGGMGHGRHRGQGQGQGHGRHGGQGQGQGQGNQFGQLGQGQGNQFGQLGQGQGNQFGQLGQGQGQGQRYRYGQLGQDQGQGQRYRYGQAGQGQGYRYGQADQGQRYRYGQTGQGQAGRQGGRSSGGRGAGGGRRR